MPPADATTLRGSLLTLGKDDPVWLDTLDRRLGRVLTGTSIQQSTLGVYGWIDSAETSNLVQDALQRSTQRLRSLRGHERRELVIAVHTALVATAFFESVREVLTDDFRQPELVEWHQEDHSFVSYLYSDDLPVPSSAREFVDNLTEITHWAADRAERVHRALCRTNSQSSSEQLLEPGFTDGVTSLYAQSFLTAAADVPEFALWAGPSETDDDMVKEYLSTTDLPVIADDPLAPLHAVNLAALNEPLSGMRDVPAVRDVYVTPSYRVARAGPTARLADDGWWSAETELRDDLDRMLVGHLTGVEATRTPLLIIGGPGSGKSALAKMLAARLPHEKFVVVRVSLAQADPDEAIPHQIRRALHELTAGKVTWDDLLDEGTNQIRVVVLDGLDMMLSTTEGPRLYLEQVIRFQQLESRYGTPVTVVVTSRTSFVDQLIIPEGTSAVQLAGYNEDQVRQWVEAWNRANPATWRRHLTLDSVLRQPEMIRTPLLLSMFTLHVTDPAIPQPTDALSVVDLYERFWQRRVASRRADLDQVAIVSLIMFNRGGRPISPPLLHADLITFGYDPDTAVVEDLLREHEKQPTTFAEYEVAAFLMKELVALSSRRGRPDDDLLFALLSHRPLAHRPSTLTFLTQLAEEMYRAQGPDLERVLDNLVRGYRDRQRAGRFSRYRPTPQDPVHSLAVYSANLVLLRLFACPFDEGARIGRGLSGELVELWGKGLNLDGIRATEAVLTFSEEGIVRRGGLGGPVGEDQDPDASPPGLDVVRRLTADGTPEIGQITWSASGDLLSANSSGRITCWNFEKDAAPATGGDLGNISDVAWHPTLPIAAVVQRRTNYHEKSHRQTHRVILTDFEDGQGHHLCDTGSGSRISWSPDGRSLALHDSGRLVLVDAESGAEQWRYTFLGESRAAYRLKPRWTPDGKQILVAVAGAVCVLDAQNLVSVRTFQLGVEKQDIFVTADGRVLAASISRGHTGVEVKELTANKMLAVLEEPAGLIASTRFSPDGSYLASLSTDNALRIWRSRDWQCVAVLPREDISRRGGLAFHPTKPLLAVKDGNSVDIIHLDYRRLGAIGAARSARRYANAKVVLVGDTGVGKSGLGLVLSGQPFAPTDSTHGRNVWTFEKSYVTTPSGDLHTRETMIWDLAGQPGYRMVHQLHLNEVAVALVVFDARSETDPFAGVQYWSRALTQARHLDGAAAIRSRIYLVAARIDRGGTAVGSLRIEQAARALGFDGYLETSAKEGWGVDELVRTVRNAIDWDAVPTVSSTTLFQSIKDFVLEEKKQGRILTTVDDLLHTFRRVRQDETPQENFADGFTACIGRLESVGVVRRMAFGDYVLLRPELLDAYASSLVQAAKDEPDGLGFVSETAALEGGFRMPESERLTNGQQERILLITVVEELLRREIALKEVTDKEVDLIFPSQFTRERPDAPDLPGPEVVFAFDGVLHSIYSTLAVRLSHSRLFTRGPMFHNSASYLAEAGGMCSIAIREIEEGKGELALFYDEQVQPIVRRQFEAYVVEHLEQRAVTDTIELRRMRVCKPCGQAVDQKVVQRRLSLGFRTVVCQICERPISIVDEKQPDVRPAVAEMNSHANAQRDQDVAATTLKGKREAHDYDVFLCHNVKDKAQVLEIAKKLEARGILPWLDVHAIRPGSRWQPQMADGIEKSRSAVVLLGPAGRGPWHEAEMELIHDWSVRDSRRRVIPVILDGTDQDLELPGFLRVWSTIDMRMADPDPFEQLIWGITGEQPRWA